MVLMGTGFKIEQKLSKRMGRSIKNSQNRCTTHVVLPSVFDYYQ